MSQITNIKITELYEHPHNPRRDVGDVTELAESIKESGIFQNLTVVPGHLGTDKGYTVIIGHRRLAAAKQAGLTELPCSVVEMSKKEQLATMLLENMQRCDLTLYEQAQGLQMMLKLGETKEDISKRTGLSKTTIDRRISLLSLNQEKFKETQGRNISLMDLERIAKIKDEDLKDKCLDVVGTKDYEYTMRNAEQEQKKRIETAEKLEKIKAFADEIFVKPDTESFAHECRFYLDYTPNIDSKLASLKDGEYVFYKDEYGAIEMYRKMTEDDIAVEKQAEIERDKDEEEKEKWISFANEKNALMYFMRRDFVQNYNGNKRKDLLVLCQALADELGRKFYISTNMQVGLKNILGCDKSEYNNPEKLLLSMLYVLTGDSDFKGYINPYNIGGYDTRANDNYHLDKLYELFEKLGYEIADEERQIINGTHEMFKGDEGK